MLDTTALIPALGAKIRCKEDRASRELFNAMLAQAGCTIYIATPSIAELRRRAPAKVVPRTDRVVVVSFDERAAHLLGTKFPPHVLKEYRDKAGARLDYIKYDAMIVACALRWKAEMIVSANGDIAKLAAHAKLPCSTAHDAMKYRTLPMFPETISNPPTLKPGPRAPET